VEDLYPNLYLLVVVVYIRDCSVIELKIYLNRLVVRIIGDHKSEVVHLHLVSGNGKLLVGV